MEVVGYFDKKILMRHRNQLVVILIGDGKDTPLKLVGEIKLMSEDSKISVIGNVLFEYISEQPSCILTQLLFLRSDDILL